MNTSQELRDATKIICLRIQRHSEELCRLHFGFVLKCHFAKLSKYFSFLFGRVSSVYSVHRIVRQLVDHLCCLLVSEQLDLCFKLEIFSHQSLWHVISFVIREDWSLGHMFVPGKEVHVHGLKLFLDMGVGIGGDKWPAADMVGSHG